MVKHWWLWVIILIALGYWGFNHVKNAENDRILPVGYFSELGHDDSRKLTEAIGVDLVEGGQYATAFQALSVEKADGRNELAVIGGVILQVTGREDTNFVSVPLDTAGLDSLARQAQPEQRPVTVTVSDTVRYPLAMVVQFPFRVGKTRADEGILLLKSPAGDELVGSASYADGELTLVIDGTNVVLKMKQVSPSFLKALELDLSKEPASVANGKGGKMSPGQKELLREFLRSNGAGGSTVTHTTTAPADDGDADADDGHGH